MMMIKRAMGKQLKELLEAVCSLMIELMEKIQNEENHIKKKMDQGQERMGKTLKAKFLSI